MAAADSIPSVGMILKLLWWPVNDGFSVTVADGGIAERTHFWMRMVMMSKPSVSPPVRLHLSQSSL